MWSVVLGADMCCRYTLLHGPNTMDTGLSYWLLSITVQVQSCIQRCSLAAQIKSGVFHPSLPTLSSKLELSQSQERVEASLLAAGIKPCQEGVSVICVLCAGEGIFSLGNKYILKPGVWLHLEITISRELLYGSRNY